MRDEERSVAVIGLGAMFPKAASLADYWDLLRRGEDAITSIPLTHWRPADYFDTDPKAPDRTYAKRGGFLLPYDFSPLEYGISPKAMEATDTSQLLAMVVAHEALKDAGYGPDRDFDRDRTSCILGVTGTLELVVPLAARLGHPRWLQALKEAGVDEETAQDVMERISDSYVGWQENSFPGLLGNVVAGRVAQRANLGGTNTVVDSACGSSLSALNVAYLELLTGRADMVITGGVDTFNDIFMYMCFSKTPALSPTGDARPFDKMADGTMLGEGVGMVILKRLSDAQKAGDKIYAVIKGIGTSSDGKGQAIYAPSPKGQAKALCRAYSEAGFAPATIGLLEAHGTGTKAGDAAEFAALQEVYGDKAPTAVGCAIGSVKSQIGHTKAAAGVAGLIKVVMALYHKVIPPTIKIRQPADKIATSSFYLAAKAQPWTSDRDHPRRAAVSAFGFGGSNFHCVLQEHRSEKPLLRLASESQILPFSADSRSALIDELSRFSVTTWEGLRREAYRLRAEFKSTRLVRLVVVVERSDKPMDKIAAAVKMLQSDPERLRWQTPDAIYYSSMKVAHGKIALVFPGQGAQYINMGRSLANCYPEMLDAIEAGNLAFHKHSRKKTRKLSHYVYPPEAFDLETKKNQITDLTRTEIAQVAVGAVSLGMTEVLARFGVRFDMVAGHSFGELTALYAAGVYDASTFLSLAAIRGQLMATAAGEDSGTMLAVKGAHQQITELIGQHKLDVVIANHNSPLQVVVAGPMLSIESAEAIFNQAGLPTKRMSVAAAFHTDLVAGASLPFKEVVRPLNFSRPRIQVFANTTAQPYPEAEDEIKRLLTEQLAQPVLFVDEIRNMRTAGATIFIEVGPGARLTGLVKDILRDDPELIAIAADSGSDERSEGVALARVLARLSAEGIKLDLTQWDADFTAAPEKTGLIIPICGANYVQEKSPKSPKPRASEALKLTKPNDAHEANQEATDNRFRIEGVNLNKTDSPGHNVAETTISRQPSRNMLSKHLELTQENLLTLQKLHQQNAELHRRFLEGQENSQRMFSKLLDQQQQLLQSISSDDRSTDKIATAIAINSDDPYKSMPPLPVFGTELSKMTRSTDSGAPAYRNAPGIALPPFDSSSVATPEVLPTVTSSFKKSNENTAQQITGILLKVVAEKTGYPIEMIELSMSLEDDLGIDSIKRVEILSAMQADLSELPEFSPDELGALRKLEDIVELFTAPIPTPSSKAAVIKLDDESTDKVVKSTKSGRESLAEILIGVIAEKTGFPPEMISTEMDLEGDLGIDSIKRVEVFSALQELVPAASDLTPELTAEFRTLAKIIDYLSTDEVPEVNTSPDGSATEALQVPLSAHQLETNLFAIVADKTGFPVEMLNLDMDMEVDLGIDSIKRVEIFSALQTAMPEIGELHPDDIANMSSLRETVEGILMLEALTANEPLAATTTDEALDLGNMSSRQSQFVEESSSAYRPEEGKKNLTDHLHVPVAGETLIFGTEADETAGSIEDKFRSLRFEAKKVFGDEKARVERIVVEADILPGQYPQKPLMIEPGSPIWIIDDGSSLALELVKGAQKLGYAAELITANDFATISPPKKLGGLIVLAPAKLPGAAGDDFLLRSFEWLKIAGPGLLAAANLGGAIAVTVSRGGGKFGLDGLTNLDSAYGCGLAGLLKTAALEWSEVACKAIDIDPAFEGEGKVGKEILREFFCNGLTEVGLSKNGRATPGLRNIPIKPSALSDEPVLLLGDIIIVTGGARGVTAQVAIALAKKFKPTLVILGRSPEPMIEESWLIGLKNEEEIKRAILRQAAPRSTPRDIEKRYQKVMINREMLQNFSKIRKAGAVLVYKELDITEVEAVGRVITEIQENLGAIVGFVHGAGVLADRLILNKTSDQFKQVLATKVAGFRNIYSCLKPDLLKVMVLFSSSTGRYGRKGQADYAVANEVLNKMAQYHTAHHSECRTVAVNWGPWDGGMVTPSLKKLFQSEGIGIIPLESGANYLMDEISLPAGNHAEVVVLGIKEKALALADAAEGANALDFQVSLDSYPILASHVINGKAVVPTVLIVEWLGQAALAMNPSLNFHGFRDLRILKGIILGPHELRKIKVVVEPAVRRKNIYEVTVEITSISADSVTFKHSQAKVLLGENLPRKKLMSSIDLESEPYGTGVYEIYNQRTLFHGELLRGIRDVSGLSRTGITIKAASAPEPREWIIAPNFNHWLTDPLILDSAFQAMVLWTSQNKGAASLPCAIKSYKQFRADYPDGDCEVRVLVTEENLNMVVAAMEIIDDKGEVVARIDGYEAVVDRSLGDSFRKNEIAIVQDHV